MTLELFDPRLSLTAFTLHFFNLFLFLWPVYSKNSVPTLVLYKIKWSIIPAKINQILFFSEWVTIEFGSDKNNNFNEIHAEASANLFCLSWPLNCLTTQDRVWQLSLSNSNLSLLHLTSVNQKHSSSFGPVQNQEVNHTYWNMTKFFFSEGITTLCSALLWRCLKGQSLMFKAS